MGNKKGCSCGYWNQAQQECLYHGLGCVYDDREKLEVTEKFIQTYIEMIREDPHQCTRENLIGMLREAGVEVIID